MLNQQAQSITGMYPSTLLHLLLCEDDLATASAVLDYWQRLYRHRLLSLPDQHSIKENLPISLRLRDASFQLGELPDNTLTWTENRRSNLYGQWLAW